MSPLVLFVDELDAYNAGVKAAVEANRYRPLRERFLDALYETNDKQAAR